VTTAVVLDDHVLEVFPGLDAALADAGALVMRSFKNTPNPQLLRRHAGVAVVGGKDKLALMARLERATTTLAAIPAPVVAVLPRGVPPTPDLLGPGVVDLLPAGTPRPAERILLMAKVPVVTGSRPRLRAVGPVAAPSLGVATPPPAHNPSARPLPGGPVHQLVAVASSTGGVWVVGAMLRELPSAGRAVAVAQHMDAEFMSFFAQWLGDTSGWQVVTVDRDTPLQAGAVYVPAGGLDLVIEGDRARALPSTSRYVPSADRLLASAATRGASAVAVVLSGMGRDGAAGLAAVVRAGGTGICQEPRTAVVASMPESALGAAPGARVAAPEVLASVVVSVGRA
jgi:two-component system chemotaxis response regulator CheB